MMLLMIIGRLMLAASAALRCLRHPRGREAAVFRLWGTCHLEQVALIDIGPWRMTSHIPWH